MMASLFDDSSRATGSTTKKIKDPMKRLWCQTQWTNLSHQAQLLNIDPTYFDEKTMLMDKLVNKKLWQLIVGVHLHQLLHRPSHTYMKSGADA